MAFKTINGVVTKTSNKETGWRRMTHYVAQHGKRKQVVVAEIIKGQYAGAKQLMTAKSALKSPHKYSMVRFADKEDIAKVFGNAAY